MSTLTVYREGLPGLSVERLGDGFFFMNPQSTPNSIGQDMLYTRVMDAVLDSAFARESSNYMSAPFAQDTVAKLAVAKTIEPIHSSY